MTDDNDLLIIVDAKELSWIMLLVLQYMSLREWRCLRGMLTTPYLPGGFAQNLEVQN